MRRPYGGVGRWLPYAGVAVILLSALLTGIYMMTVLVRAYFPKIGETVADDKVTDPTWKMLVPLIVFTVVILVIGVNPAPLMECLMKIGGEVGV